MRRRLDLGCGTKRRPGFIGLDRFSLAGAGVVGDLDAGFLPFADNSFELILAFHSLEHVRDLGAAMQEIWRVAIPGAQVVITAPYWASQLNMANPYHKQHFNEHTPRFWTSAPHSDIDTAEWQEPPLGAQWGLSESDHSRPGFEFRCVRIEFFYFSEYWGLAPAMQRRFRKRRVNVCEQILYHLIAVKNAADAASIAAHELYLPPELDARRQAARSARRRWWPK